MVSEDVSRVSAHAGGEAVGRSVNKEMGIGSFGKDDDPSGNDFEKLSRRKMDDCRIATR